MAKDDDNDQAQDASGSGSFAMKWLVIGLLAVVLIGGGAAAYFILGAKDGANPASAEAVTGESDSDPQYEAKTDSPPLYLPIAPALTVNFSNPTSGGKYLQVLMQVMSRDRKVIDALKDNMPAIRNDLIVLLSEQDPISVRSAEGKLQLQQDALENMKKALSREDPVLAQGIEAVYFDKFVIQ